MVSFINLPSLRFPKQNRLTLEGLEAVGHARRRKKQQRKQALEHQNRMFDEENRRFDAELALRQKKADRAFQLARQRAGPLMRQPSFAGLSSTGVGRPDLDRPRVYNPSLKSPHAEHQMMDSAMPHQAKTSYADLSNAK